MKYVLSIVVMLVLPPVHADTWHHKRVIVESLSGTDKESLHILQKRMVDEEWSCKRSVDDEVVVCIHKQLIEEVRHGAGPKPDNYAQTQ